MKIKKGDYVLNYCDSEMQIDIGQVADEPSVEGEFDLDFIGGGSMSPAHQHSVIIPRFVAEFLSGAINLLPIDKTDGLQKLPEDIVTE